MRCHQFKLRMNDLLDQRLAPELDTKLRVHARRCPHCRELLRLQSDVLTVLAQPSATAPINETIPRRRTVSWIPLPHQLTRGSNHDVTRETSSIRWAGGWAIVAILIALHPWRFGWQHSTTAPRVALPSSIRPTPGSALTTQFPVVRDQHPDWLTSWSIVSPLSWGMVASQVQLDGHDQWWQRWDASVSRPWWGPVEESISPLAQSLASAVSVLRSAWPIARHAVVDAAPDGAFHPPSSIGGAERPT